MNKWKNQTILSSSRSVPALKDCRPFPSWKQNILFPYSDHLFRRRNPGARLSPWSHNTSNSTSTSSPAAVPFPLPLSSGSSTYTTQLTARTGLVLQNWGFYNRPTLEVYFKPFALALYNDECLRNTVICLQHANIYSGCKSEIGISPPEIIPKTQKVKKNNQELGLLIICINPLTATVALRKNKLRVYTQSSWDSSSLTIFELVSLDSFFSWIINPHIYPIFKIN